MYLRHGTSILSLMDKKFLKNNRKVWLVGCLVFFTTKLKKPLRNTEFFPLVHHRGEAIYFLPSCNVMLHDGDATEYFVVELKEILLRKYSQNKSVLFI